jgi:ABC-type transporter Mla subunit MlaD
MRRLALIATVFAVAGAFAASIAGADDSHTYKLEMYNAFGLVEGSEVKVAGVNAGTVTDLEINEEKRAVLTVELTGPLAVLGADTQCSSEPQSLIAEYFIDCRPQGPPLEDGATLDKLVTQTVQNDLVLNTLRMPFKQRFQLLINEFGTALAGNPENLNEAIEMGAPALQDLNKALRMIAAQNDTIRQLNVDSDVIIGKLAARSDDVVRFIQEAGDAAVASAERRDDLSTDFDLLDDALRELGPTMAELENVARQSTPLLADLRAAGPGLDTLATNLPGFARASERSLRTLGGAAQVGRRALDADGREVIDALGDASRGAPQVAENVSFFLEDISDPRRIVEIDERAARSCGNEDAPCYSTGRSGPTGYTGMEGILNYLYYQGGALNQFDEVGHTLHFSLYDVFASPCGSFNASQEVPAEGGGTTTNILDADSCVGWLGKTQPGINESEESICAEAPAGQLCSPRYDDSVCPDGSNEPEICDPGVSIDSTSARRRGSGGGGTAAGRDEQAGPGLPVDPSELADPDDVRGQLEDLLDQAGGTLDDSPLGEIGGIGGIGGLDGRGDKRGDGRGGSSGGGGGQATEDLLDFLLGP